MWRNVIVVVFIAAGILTTSFSRDSVLPSLAGSRSNELNIRPDQICQSNNDGCDSILAWKQYRLKNAFHSISNMKICELRDLETMQNLVGSVGLNFDTRDLYGEFKSFQIAGRGLWQNPREFATFLIKLSHHNISTFFDIGPLYGFTSVLFATYLKRFNANIVVHAVDAICHWDRSEIAAIAHFLPIQYHCPSDSRFFRSAKVDAAFIDGHHEYSHVANDWNNIGSRAKITGIHDVLDSFIANDPTTKGGNVLFWKNLVVSSDSQDFSFVEIFGPKVRTSNSNFGIGVAERKKK